MTDTKPLITRLAVRYSRAIELMNSNTSWTNASKASNRIGHVLREAEKAGISYEELNAEITRLASAA